MVLPAGGHTFSKKKIASKKIFLWAGDGVGTSRSTWTPFLALPMLQDLPRPEGASLFFFLLFFFFFFPPKTLQGIPRGSIGFFLFLFFSFFWFATPPRPCCPLRCLLFFVANCADLKQKCETIVTLLLQTHAHSLSHSLSLCLSLSLSQHTLSHAHFYTLSPLFLSLFSLPPTNFLSLFHSLCSLSLSLSLSLSPALTLLTHSLTVCLSLTPYHASPPHSLSDSLKR